MKTTSHFRPLFRLATLGLAALLIAGCLKDRLAWSPDGKHAVVLTAAGLHLSDPTGTISPLLVPGAYLAAWLPDSQSLVLARQKEVRNFAEITAALGPVRARQLATKAETVWARLKDLPRGEEFDKRVSEEVGDDLSGIIVYLREQPAHLAALREKLGSDWKKEDETKPAELNEVVVARLSGGKITLGPTLFVGLPGIHALRPGPGGTAVAFTLQPELSLQPDNGITVMLAPIDASAPAVTVATQSARHPDWSADGRSLVFFKATGGAGISDDLRLGALVSREALAASGRIQLANSTTDLAGLIFHAHSRVHCLRNGQVVFNATPFSLPIAGAGGGEREQLFVLSRGPNSRIAPVIPAAALDRLPKSLAAFAFSPDETQALIGSDNGEVWLVTLATGAVEAVSAKIESNKDKGEGENFPAPVWRAPGEFTYLRKSPGASGIELVLRRGQNETVLSQGWDSALLRKLIE